MPAVAVSADKRFRRAHVKPARRSRMGLLPVVRIIRALAVLAVVGYGAWRAGALVLGASSLQVSRIAVRGNERLSLGVVLALVDGLEGQHILGVNLDRWQRRLLAYPWVEEAELRRVLPGTVEIVVRERRPMAIGRIGGRLYLVDPGGVVIDEWIARARSSPDGSWPSSKPGPISRLACRRSTSPTHAMVSSSSMVTRPCSVSAIGLSSSGFSRTSTLRPRCASA
jgi:POTRA domain, FtsQ-type